jgi:hypothetical protein
MEDYIAEAITDFIDDVSSGAVTDTCKKESF